MAAPKKTGLDYFPHEIGLLKDRKLRVPKLKFGHLAANIYLVLLEMIYGDKGYYIEYASRKDDVVWEILEYVQGRFQPSPETVSDVIEELVACELFSRDHFPKIITSKRVQQIYYSATVDRKAVTVDIDKWLLSKSEMSALSAKSSILSFFEHLPINDEKRPNNEDNRPDKKQSTVKDIINVSMYKNIPDHECEPRKSYAEIMEDMQLETQVQPAIWEFIKHCQANGHVIINSKLTDILVRLDLAYPGDAEAKIEALRQAVNGGYYDIWEGHGD